MQILDPAFDPAAIKLLVYDLDGTLVDAFEDIWNGVNHAFRTVGLPELPFEQVKSYVGDGARTLMERCLGPANAARFAEAFPVFAKFYTENPEPKARLYDGVVETLRALRGRGLKQAILSNKPHAVSLITCKNIGLDKLVDAIWGEEEGRARKPDPAALRMVLEHFGVTPAEAAMVGDGPADYAVARAAGVPMIAVEYGMLTREQALEARPAVLLEGFGELNTLFARGKAPV